MSTTAQITCKTTYTIRCIFCGTEVENYYTVWHGTQVPMPSLPDGWRLFNGCAVCPKHKIRITVDRKNVTDRFF